MKTLFLSTLIITGLIITKIEASHANQQKPQVRFYCGQSFDRSSNKILPTTFAATSTRTEPLAIIRWKTSFAGYNPQNRCNIVSQKFQTAWKGGRLKFLSAGTAKKTGQGIICGTASQGNTCDESSMLFTLKNSQAAGDIIDSIYQIQHGTNRDPISQSSGGSGSIDLEELLK
jgi:hypothetical protein